MTARIASPVFVGRGEELRRLQAVLDDAGSGVVGTVIVGGEAGVGKTRLLAELRTGAETAGFRFLVGGCVDLGDGARPYDPLVAALRPWLKALPPDEFNRIVGPARSAVRQLIPDLEAGGEAAADPGTSETQSTLYLQVLGLIERIAADAVTVIVLEDLHWSDRSTRDMLRFLVRNLTHGRVALVGTYRTDELHERHPFLVLLAELGRTGQVQRLELVPFTAGEVHDQLAGILGRPPDRALVTRLHERSGGNAFFTEELLAVEQRGERLGLTLRETLLARIGTLSPASRHLLRVVAVAGQSARHDVLAAVTRMEPAEMAGSLREAIDRYLLLAGDDEVMQFRHGLVREAIYDELLPGERLALHAAVAAAIESAHAGLDVDAAVASELAHHWYEARDARHALPAQLRAGRAAERMFAFGNAFAHYHLAIGLWPVGVDAVDGLTRDELTLRTAEAAALAGAYRPAIELLRAALAASAETPVAELDRIRTGTLLERLAVYHLGSGNPDAAEPVALRALDSLPVEPPSAARAQVLGIQAQALGLKCHFSASNRIAQEALATARAVGSAAAEIRALGCIGRNAASVGEAEAGVRTLREALDLARSVGDVTGAAEMSIELALALHWAGDLEEACRVAEEGITESGRWGTEGYGNALRSIRGVSAFRLGRWAEADDWITGALDRDPVGSHGVLAHGARALLDLGRGDLDSAAEHLEIVLLMCRAFTATAYGWTDLYSSIALLSIERGLPSEAVDSVRESLARSAEPERDVHMRICHRLAVRAAADLAELARPLGDAAGLAEALAIGREFDAHLDHHARLVRALPGGGDPHLDLDVALAKAELSRLEGRPSGAAWAAAAVAAGELQHPHDAAYSRFRQAEAILLARGSRQAAQAAAQEAHRLASELGAVPLQRDIERLAARSRLDLANRPVTAERPPAPVAAIRGFPFRLTAREQDVLERLTAGHTNREIATDLYISEKTASVHVSNIKSKLGANGRAEIAAIAVRLGLVPETVGGDELS